MVRRMYGVIHGHTIGHGQGPGYCKHVKMYWQMLDCRNVSANVRMSNILANVGISNKIATVAKCKYEHVNIYFQM